MKIKMLFTCVALLTMVVSTFASPATITYTGQGFTLVDGVAILNSQRCGAEGQGLADDGGTGLFANWNGVGQPYVVGDPYLVWVLTLNTGGANVPVTLHLPDGEVQMIKVGGTYKYASKFYSYQSLISFPVHATYGVNGRNVQLVVSHGCPRFEGGNGAFCSPGYWKNALDGAWQFIGFASALDGKAALFNNTVVPNFYDTASSANPTLGQVLTTPGANTFGAASAPFGLNAFNATGAYLSDRIPGFEFTLDAYIAHSAGDDSTCPIDHHGNLKNPQ